MGKHILVIGSLNMDLSITMERMPAVGETVMGEELTYNLGGKGANQAYAVGRLGGQVKMLGCVGRDQFGAGQRESLAACGVDVSGLRESKALPTGTAVIYVDAAGSNSIVVVAGANQACDTQYLKENDHLFQWCDYVLMQMEIPMSAIAYAAGRARALGKTVILVLHEINYAAFYSDYVCAFAEGRIAKFGTVREVINKETLSELYKVDFEILEIAGKPLSVYY